MLSPSIVPMVSANTRKGVWEGGFWKSRSAQKCKRPMVTVEFGSRPLPVLCFGETLGSSECTGGRRIRVAGQDTAQKKPFHVWHNEYLVGRRQGSFSSSFSWGCRLSG